MKNKDWKIKLEYCKTEINIINNSAFLNIQLPSGRWITFKTETVDPPIKRTNVKDSIMEAKP